MRRNSEKHLDEVDFQIIEELVIDGRIPITHLAAKAGISRHNARKRLERIIGQEFIKVVAYPIWQVSDLPIQVSVGINVKPGNSVYEVAEILGKYPNFVQVALVTGPYDILAWAFFKNLQSLSFFLKYEISKIPGLASNETQLHLETVKYFRMYPTSKKRPLKEDILLFPRKKVMQEYRPDSLDLAVIEELQKDGRIMVSELAKKLGISRLTATKKLQRLLSEGIIVITAFSTPDLHKITAMIGIKILPGTGDDIASQLGSFRAVHFIAMTLGQYDILISVHFSDLNELSRFIRDELKNMAGVVKTESMVYLEFTKSPYDLF